MMRNHPLYPLFRRRLGSLGIALGLSIVTLAAGAALLGVSGWFVTATALAGAATAFNFLGPSAVVRALALTRIVARYGERLTGHAATLRLLADLRVHAFRTAVPHANARLGGLRDTDMVSRLTADVDALDTVFLQVVSPVIAVICVGGIAALVLAFILPAAAVALVAGLIIAVLILPLVLARAARGPGREATEAAAGLRAATLDGIEGAVDLATLGATAEARGTFLAAADRLGTARRREAAIAARGSATVQALAGGVMLVTLVAGLMALDATDGDAAIGGAMLAAAVLLTFAVFEGAGPVMRGWARLGRAAAAARRLRELSATPPALADPPEPRSLPADGVLSFESVGFGYGQHRAVLSGLDLALRPGERVAIVGISGSGKSTIARLALRLDDPAKGRVRFGEVDLRHCAQAELHRRIALMSQASAVFLGTLRENLAIGDPGADDERMMAALAAARLDGWVAGLPQELDTHVGEAGATMSAGQARRLCLARVLLSPARILVLDEPTAGLDHEAEQALLADLATATAGRSVLLVTHAHLPAGAVDRVLRLEGGRLTPVTGGRAQI